MSRARELYVTDPPSDEIARSLNEANARTCVHDRNPCLLRCGVALGFGAIEWQPIPKDVRENWLAGLSP